MAVELGRHLFYDVRLSANRTQACATCHQPQRAFTDGRPRAVGSTGAQHALNTPSLANVGTRRSFGWTRPRTRSLEKQTLVPMFNKHPVELGFDDTTLARIRDDQRYAALFAEAFPGERRPISVRNIARSLAAFQRTLISDQSPWDRASRDLDHAAISDAAWRGVRVFFARCVQCHEGRDFSVERGPIRVATLRNVALTAPYLHDGSKASLSDVLTRYELSPTERQDVLAFLETLTDTSFTTDQRNTDPWDSSSK